MSSVEAFAVLCSVQTNKLSNIPGLKILYDDEAGLHTPVFLACGLSSRLLVPCSTDGAVLASISDIHNIQGRHGNAKDHVHETHVWLACYFDGDFPERPFDKSVITGVTSPTTSLLTAYSDLIVHQTNTSCVGIQEMININHLNSSLMQEWTLKGFVSDVTKKIFTPGEVTAIRPREASPKEKQCDQETGDKSDLPSKKKCRLDSGAGKKQCDYQIEETRGKKYRYREQIIGDASRELTNIFDFYSIKGKIVEIGTRSKSDLVFVQGVCQSMEKNAARYDLYNISTGSHMRDIEICKRNYIGKVQLVASLYEGDFVARLEQLPDALWNMCHAFDLTFWMEDEQMVDYFVADREIDDKLMTNIHFDITSVKTNVILSLGFASK